MITLIILTLLALLAEIIVFCLALCIVLLPIIGLFKLIEWMFDR